MNFKAPYFSIALLCLLLGCQNFASAANSQNGILDLRQQNFLNNTSLNGKWQFYWDQLLFPGDTPNTAPAMVDFPFLWNGYNLNGKKLPAFGYATYMATVLLPKNHAAMRIGLPEVYSAYSLFLNGKKVAFNGIVDTSAAGFVPHWIYRGVDIPAGLDTLKLILQIANFVHSKAGISDPITIGFRANVELQRQQDAAIDLLLTGCLFMGGLFFVGLFLTGHKDRAILLFSLFCIVYSYRLAGTDTYVLHTILPNFSWYIAIRLEYISLFLGIGIFGAYLNSLYPLDVNRKIVYAICAFCFTFTLSVLVLPPIYFTQLINPFLVVSVFCLVYTPYVYIKAYRRKRPGSVYALISTFALMIVFAISLLHYWAIIPRLSVISFSCYIIFFFLQSLSLSYRVSFHLKRAKQQAEEGLKAKSEFLSTMSHEIRTPLNAVIGLTHLLLKSEPRDEQKEYLDVMLFSANNLLAIVNDVLDYNKIEAGKISFEEIEMDVASILKNVAKGMEMIAAEKSLSLRVNIQPGINTKVMSDPTRTTQVISNLVNNAIKFTKEGYVEVGAQLLEENKHYVTLKIWVKDTGIGIAPEKHKLIFDRFTQADSTISRGFGGTGLGLAISKKMLELQDSALQLESALGEGSTFYFVQRFIKSNRQPEKLIEPAVAAGENKRFAGVNILLVEDNPMNVLIAQTHLKKWGAEIDVAVNGLEALERVHENTHSLILLDIHMPVMDGYEAAQKLREMGINMPIIALTANLPTEVMTDALAAGMNDVLGKPFLPEELFNKVLKYTTNGEAV